MIKLEKKMNNSIRYEIDIKYVFGNKIQQKIIEKLNNEQELGEMIEFGCGKGYYTKLISDQAKHIIAIDFSDEILEEARRNLIERKNIYVQKANCERTFFSSNKFDSLLMINVLHIMQDPSIILKECHRILKKDGLLIITDYTNYGLSHIEKIKLIIRYIKRFGLPPRNIETNLSPDELISIVENQGFNIEEIELINDKINALYLKGKKNGETNVNKF